MFWDFNLECNVLLTKRGIFLKTGWTREMLLESAVKAGSIAHFRQLQQLIVALSLLLQSATVSGAPLTAVNGRVNICNLDHFNTFPQQSALIFQYFPVLSYF